jgi:hypothetical protein
MGLQRRMGSVWNVEIIVKDAQQIPVRFVIMAMCWMMVVVSQLAITLAILVKWMLLILALLALEAIHLIPGKTHVSLIIHAVSAPVRVVPEGISYRTANAKSVKRTATSVPMQQLVPDVFLNIMWAKVPVYNAQKNAKHALLLPVVSRVHQGIIYNLIRQVFLQGCASLAPRMFSVGNARSLITFVLHA